MLILGGRYGSVESKSGKSYTQLEYEYALNRNIPVFTVVLSKDFLTSKINSLGLEKTMEQDYPDKHKSFKTTVMSKIIREVDDCKDIKIAIHSTLNEFINEFALTGWIRNSKENDTIQLLKDNTNLLKENNLLNKQIQKLQEQLNAKSKEQFGNFSFDELVKVFKNKEFNIPSKFTKQEKDLTINALDFFITYFSFMVTGIDNIKKESDYEAYMFYDIAPYYVSFDFLERIKLPNTTAQRIHTTKLGSSFYAMLEFKGMTK